MSWFPCEPKLETNFYIKLLIYTTTGGKFVVADQKIAGRNKAPLYLHLKQSRKLPRSCFSWRFFAFHSAIYKLSVILLKIDQQLFVLG
jgi:glutathione peroxidase-family protein